MNRTQVAAILTAFLNFVVAVSSGLGFSFVTPELVSALNGFLLPVILVFLGDKVDRVEEKTITTQAAVHRVEAAQPAPGSPLNG